MVAGLQHRPASPRSFRDSSPLRIQRQGQTSTHTYISLIMIYRPAPLTELKAQAIYNIIAAEIVKKRQRQTTANQENDEFVDKGLEPAQGRREAIRKQIIQLEEEQRRLLLSQPVIRPEPATQPQPFEDRNDIDVEMP